MQKYDMYKYYDSMLRRILNNSYVTDTGRTLTVAEIDKMF